MIASHALPNRRVEAWKWSDLRAALGDVAPPMLGEGEIIERLAAGAGTATTRDVAAGEVQVAFELFGGDAFDPRAENVRVGAGGTYHRIVIQAGGGVPLGFCRVHLAEGAVFRQFVYAEGGRLARMETAVSVAGPGARLELGGVYLTGAGHHADLTSRVEILAPFAEVRQTVRGVVRKGGRGVFQGRIDVARAAQKTDARQHHQALLLEDGGEVDAKPELIIHADDVACAHGNAIGGLDGEGLFYLRARGLPEREARALMIEAFVLEALPDWAEPEARSQIEHRIRAWLESA